MKFSLALKGKRAERNFTFPVPGADGKVVDLECTCVPLTVREEGEAIEYAIFYARMKGIAEPQPADPLYDMGYMAKVVALAVRDPDTGVPGDREATFTGGVDEVHTLTRETLVLIFTIVQDWCDQCSPLKRNLSDAQLLAGMQALAKEGDDGDRFFDRLGPAMRRTFTRSMARQLVSFLEPPSPDGTASASSDTTTPSGSSPSPSPSG